LLIVTYIRKYKLEEKEEKVSGTYCGILGNFANDINMLGNSNWHFSS